MLSKKKPVFSFLHQLLLATVDRHLLPTEPTAADQLQRNGQPNDGTVDIARPQVIQQQTHHMQRQQLTDGTDRRIDGLRPDPPTYYATQTPV